MEQLWADLVRLVKAREDVYEELYEYWVGEQDLPVDSSEFRSRFGAFFTGYRDNLTRPIIESAEARTKITHFDGRDAEQLSEIWEENDLLTEHRLVHTDAMVYGDAYVIVLPHNQMMS